MELAPLSYPSAACCRLKGRSQEWPLPFAGGAHANAGISVRLQFVQWGGQGDTVQMIGSGVPARRLTYLNALRAPPEVEIHFGNFLASTDG